LDPRHWGQSAAGRLETAQRIRILDTTIHLDFAFFMTTSFIWVEWQNQRTPRAEDAIFFVSDQEAG